MKNLILLKTFRILEAIATASQPVSLKSLVVQLKLNTSTVSRITADLLEAGYIRKRNYREFEPALGMIFLGQCATRNLSFHKQLKRIIRSRCRILHLNGALAELFNDELVYLFLTMPDDLTDRSDLPFSCLLHKSNIAIVLLCRRYGGDKALQLLRKSLRDHEHDLDTISQHEQFLAARIEEFQQHGYSLWKKGNAWNVCVPVIHHGECLGLSLFCRPSRSGSDDLLVAEGKALAARLEDELIL